MNFIKLKHKMSEPVVFIAYFVINLNFIDNITRHNGYKHTI